MPVSRPEPSRTEARRRVSPAFDLGYRLQMLALGLVEMNAGAAAATEEFNNRLEAAEAEEYRRLLAAAKQALPEPAREERCFAHDLGSEHKR